MKIALVHDYLNEAGGAERVLRVLSEMYPEAPIYTALAKKSGSAYITLQECDIRESKWGWFLKIGRFYSYFRFLLPLIWGSIDLTKYDLVITSCSGYIARGFKVRKDTKVIAYCHTPPRWLYGYDTPTGAMGRWWGRAFMWIVGPFMRYFDFQSAQRVDVWIANSQEVARRITKFYRRDSIVVYPPACISFAESNAGRPIEKRLDYYLMVSRIVGGKGIGEAAAAFKTLGIKLKIVGEIITPLNHYTIESHDKIEFLGRVSDDELPGLYGRARGFIALSRDEDFGMTVVEAMMYGTPVLAYNGGGYKETVVPGKTGILIDGTDLKSVSDGIKQMEKIKWDREAIKKWASKFGRVRFEREMRDIIKPLNH